MPDPFQEVTPGDEIVFNARAWNAMLKAGRAFQSADSLGSAPSLASSRNSAIIRVHNGTGLDLEQGAILGLDAPMFDPADNEDAFWREVAFLGVIPTASHFGRFGVLLEPAPADRVIRACVAGFAACRVAIKAPGHAYADVWPGRPDVLASCGCGSAKILWCQDAGGAPYDDNAYGTAVDNNGALAYVRTGLEAGRGRACMAPAGGIPGAATTGISPGSAACDMYNWDSAHGQWIAAGYKEVVFNNGSGPTSAAKIINVVYLSGSPFAVVDQC